MSEDHQFSSFFVDDLLFGVDVQKVQEVIRYLEITQVPLAPPMVKGLINLRGQIISAIDARSCLGLADRPIDQCPVHMIFRTENGPVSFLVDEIGAVLELREDAQAFPPATLQGRLREMISKTYQLPNRLLLVLDTERLLSAVSAEANTLIGAASGGST
jgi:purine-binding chemotaxis protein CheW